MAQATMTAQACIDTGNFDAFTDMPSDWRNTPAIWSDLGIATAIQGDTDNPMNTPVCAHFES